MISEPRLPDALVERVLARLDISSFSRDASRDVVPGHVPAPRQVERGSSTYLTFRKNVAAGVLSPEVVARIPDDEPQASVRGSVRSA